MDDEIFVPCPDYPDLFEIGSKGSLYSKRSKRIVKQTPNGKGYLGHATKIGGRHGKDVFIRTHVQVAKAFHENPDNLPEVNHKDLDKKNNDKDNLEWISGSGNVRHAIEMGAFNPIDNLPGRKLTEDQEEVLDFLVGSNAEIARDFGVHRETIRRYRKTRR